MYFLYEFMIKCCHRKLKCKCISSWMNYKKWEYKKKLKDFPHILQQYHVNINGHGIEMKEILRFNSFIKYSSYFSSALKSKLSSRTTDFVIKLHLYLVDILLKVIYLKFSMSSLQLIQEIFYRTTGYDSEKNLKISKCLFIIYILLCHWSSSYCLFTRFLQHKYNWINQN